MEGKDLHRRSLTSGGATGDGATLHPLEAAPRKWKKLSPSFEPPKEATHAFFSIEKLPEEMVSPTTLPIRFIPH